MTTETLLTLEADLSAYVGGLRCIFVDCVVATEWRWFPEKLNVMDVLTALGAFGSFLAVIFAAIAIQQSAKARNLSTVVELTRQLAAEREKAHSFKVYGMDDGTFHAYQMVHLVEQAAMIVNNDWVTGQSKQFLIDWLRTEIPAMGKQEAYQEVFSTAEGRELCELFKLRAQFEAEKERELLEKKQAEHFDRIAERWKTGKAD